MIRRVGGTLDDSGMRRASFDRPGTQGSCAPGAEKLGCSYNLFRNLRCASLVCAVPLDRPVPGFLSGHEWLFAGLLDPSDRLPSGFRVNAASQAVRRHGFHLFHLAAEPDTGRRSCASDGEIRAHVRAILMKLRGRGANLATLLSMAMFS